MIRIETDPEACRQLWHDFSPGKEAWDDWALMFAFHDADKHRFHFLVHEDGGQPDGLVPLVHDTKLRRHMLMGGSYADGRVLWLRFEDFPECFEHFPDRTALFDLEGDWVDELLRHHPQFEPNFAELELRYFLTPAEFGFDFQNHLDGFGTEKRQKFMYDLRNIRKREPVLRWSDDDEAELFIRLVNKNFGAASDYADEDNANEVRRVVDELARSGRLRTLVIDIDGKPEAVSLSLLYDNKMVALYSAGNGDYNNLGKLINVETINEACRMRLDEISYMTGMKWKADWKMKSAPCRTLRKPSGPWVET